MGRGGLEWTVIMLGNEKKDRFKKEREGELREMGVKFYTFGKKMNRRVCLGCGRMRD